VRFDAAVPLALRVVFADAQTNGGLLAAVHPDRFLTVMRLLADRGVAAVHIGEVAAMAPGSSRSPVPDVAGDVAGNPALEVSAGAPARKRGPPP
jgi:hypothetical protein